LEDDRVNVKLTAIAAASVTMALAGCGSSTSSSSSTASTSHPLASQVEKINAMGAPWALSIVAWSKHPNGDHLGSVMSKTSALSTEITNIETKTSCPAIMSNLGTDVLELENDVQMAQYALDEHKTSKFLKWATAFRRTAQHTPHFPLPKTCGKIMRYKS
jgi:hypothetical protein